MPFIAYLILFTFNFLTDFQNFDPYSKIIENYYIFAKYQFLKYILTLFN